MSDPQPSMNKAALSSPPHHQVTSKHRSPSNPLLGKDVHLCPLNAGQLPEWKRVTGSAVAQAKTEILSPQVQSSGQGPFTPFQEEAAGSAGGLFPGKVMICFSCCIPPS